MAEEIEINLKDSHPHKQFHKVENTREIKSKDDMLRKLINSTMANSKTLFTYPPYYKK